MSDSGEERGKARGMREVLTIRTPDGARETGVPGIVMSFPPGVSVVPARTTSSGFALKA